jgi:hypothetical protein
MQADPTAAAAASSAASGAAVAGGDATSAFACPSLILLRQKVADALQVHWERLEGLIDFGLACETRLVRLALVRLLARAAGLGAGMALVLAPKVRATSFCGSCRGRAGVRHWCELAKQVTQTDRRNRHSKHNRLLNAGYIASCRLAV